ncbi:hypothetical protein, partial [Corynebacterium afermentans]|uniref:hypothetical protein n=1 Tax=Corynebacterium afermentans TaxID=38286 RepID=UPI0025734AED
MYFFLEFLPFTKTTIGAILKNASSPFEFNSDAAAQGPSNPGRYNAMSSADRNPRRHSGKRSVIAGMTSVSLALAGLTVPSVVGGVPGRANVATAAEVKDSIRSIQTFNRDGSGKWTVNIIPMDNADTQLGWFDFSVATKTLGSNNTDRNFPESAPVTAYFKDKDGVERSINGVISSLPENASNKNARIEFDSAVPIVGMKTVRVESDLEYMSTPFTQGGAQVTITSSDSEPMSTTG